nr:Hpt domain-containing protein [Dissulfurirhabdus thermomarina]
MLELFRQEAGTHCGALGDGLLELERRPGDREVLEGLMRAAHSVKGAARIVGLDAVVAVAHALEDVFSAVLRGEVTLGGDEVDVLLRGVDFLSGVAALSEADLSALGEAKGREAAALSEAVRALLSPGDAEPAAEPDSSVPPGALGEYGDLSMLELFRQEAGTHCGALGDGLLELERRPGDREVLEGLMRAAHSVKGAARIVGLDAVVAVAHALEDVFSAVLRGEVTLGGDEVDVLLRGVDFLSGVAALSEADLSALGEAKGREAAALSEAVRALLSPGDAEPAAEPDSSVPPGALGEYGDLSMLELFRQDAATHCGALGDGLLELERRPGDREVLEGLMRAAHSVKGAARIVGLDAVVAVAHALEDVFSAVLRGEVTLGGDEVDVLLRGVDLLARLTKCPEDEMAAWIRDRAGEMSDTAAAIRALAGREAAGDSKGGAGTAAAPNPPPAGAAAGSPPRDTAVRVSAEGLNRLMGLAGENLVTSRWIPDLGRRLLSAKKEQDRAFRSLGDLLEALAAGERGERAVEAAARIRHLVDGARERLGEFQEEINLRTGQVATLSNALYREILSARMRPFAEGIRPFPRLVRDLARQLGKAVRLETAGLDTPVDREIMEKLEAPLNHLVRNALDHGLEAPDRREAAGKPREGVIRLEARHKAGMLNIVVADDGAGIDYDALRREVVRKKLVSKSMAADLSESELLDFLFLPGFTTRGTVSELSGRGVGLDVVRSAVQEVRGVVRASSVPGEGTRFELQLPITLSVVRVLLAEVDGETYAFPLFAVDHVVEMTPEDIAEIEGRQYLTWKEERIGIVSARQLFGLSEGTPGETLYALILSDRQSRYGLLVDRLAGAQELVVRALDPRLGKVQDIAAAATLEDGSPTLIVDVEDMVRSMDALVSRSRVRGISWRSPRDRTSAKRILVVDDSITVREVERKMLTARGYRVDVGVDGMDGWNAVRTGAYDLVITDVDMPRMDGVELVRHIRSDPRLARLPVVIVSYKDREDDRRRGLEAGADYYLTKGSFHDETFVRAVEELIGGPVEG